MLKFCLKPYYRWKLLSRSYISGFRAEKRNDHYVVTTPRETTEVTFQWLRDHCRSAGKYNGRTHQRKLEICESNLNSQPTHHEITEKDFIITWNDGHTSSFSWKWLEENLSNDVKTNFMRRVEPRLWDSNCPPCLAETSVDFKTYQDTAQGLKTALTVLFEFGFCLITNSPPNLEGTRLAAKRIGPTMKTPFGELWDFTAIQPETVSDTAYTSLALGPHNDGTYFSVSPGIQTFHCLKMATKGGENILVDGFQVGKKLETKHPEAYEFFRDTPLEAEYIHNETEPYYHLYNVDQVFKHHPFEPEKLIQVRYNVYDRAPHRMSLETQRKLHEFLPLLSQEMNDPENFTYHLLEPGTVLLVDNWRVLHGRKSFEGIGRRMSGCYISRIDFMNKAKISGLLI